MELVYVLTQSAIKIETAEKTSLITNMTTFDSDQLANAPRQARNKVIYVSLWDVVPLLFENFEELWSTCSRWASGNTSAEDIPHVFYGVHVWRPGWPGQSGDSVDLKEFSSAGRPA